MNESAYEALRTRAAWLDLSGRGKIRATGDDRVRLMHAMCTNHIEQLISGLGSYAFLLTPQGRILADVNVFAMPDYLLLDTEPETRQRVWDHLEKYIIADDVSLHDFTDAYATIGVEGPESEQVLNNLGGMPAHAPLSVVEWGHSQIAHWSYTGNRGYSVYVPSERKDELIRQLQDAGVRAASMEEADIVRLENGRPRYGVDFSEAQIPQETQQMQAVHFSKGCYLGQEIVERVRSRGHVNRMLTPVRIDGTSAPARGASVQGSTGSIGEITSAAYSPAENTIVGFAMLRAEALQNPAELSVNGARLTPVSPRASAH